MKDPDLEPIKVVSTAARAWDEFIATDVFDAAVISMFEYLASTVAEEFGDLDSTASVTWIAGMLAALTLIEQSALEDPMAKMLEAARAIACAQFTEVTFIAAHGPVMFVQLTVGCIASRLLAGKL